MTPAQYLFTIACFIQSSALLTSFLVSITAQDSWIAPITGYLACVPFVLVYAALMKRFPGKNLIEINQIVFGKGFGLAISILYLWFFLTLTSLNLTDLGNFVRSSMLPNTPGIVIFIIFMLLCSWGVRYGLSCVVRYSVAFSVTAILITAASILFTASHMQIEKFLPLFQQPVITYVNATHVVATIPFGETVVFLMLAPNVKLPVKKMGKYFLGGLALGGGMMLATVMRDTMVLGKTMNLFAIPSLEVYRMVHLTESMGRVEILFSIALIILLFSKVILLYYVTTLAFGQMLGTSSHKPIVLAVGALATAYAQVLNQSSLKHLASGTQSAPVFWTLFELLLPLLTLIIAALRHVRGQEEVAQQ